MQGADDRRQKMCRLESNNVPSKLVSTLFSQRKAGKYCDVTLKLGEVQLKAHGCVVTAFSHVVDKLMSDEEVTQATVGCKTLPIFMNRPRFSCVECATKVIEFMYIGKIQVDDRHLEHIRTISESLQVSELLKICKQHFDESCVRGNAGFKSLESEISDCASASPVSEPSLHDPPQHKICTPNVENVSVCEAAVTLSNLRNDDPMDESEWSGLKCPKCDLVLMSLAKYQQHCSTHLGKTYTTCCTCNYASIRVFDVIKHLQESDHNETVCSICLLQLGTNQSFKEHLQIHDQSQPFFCLTCNTRFQTRTALNSHIVRHTNETPFVCKECGRGFKWKHGLRSHMVTHSKLKSFLCDQCGFSTAHLRSFIAHKTIHSGEKFKCPKPDCQFSSVRKESLKHHLMTHSKEKPYQCEVCGQAFSQSKNLRRHATSHTADPEKCPLCPYQTSRSDKFKAHFKRYHKDGSQTERKQRKKNKSSVCFSGIPENVKETAKMLAALSTCVLSTSDCDANNQSNAFYKSNENIVMQNCKESAKTKKVKQSGLIPVDSEPPNVECVKDITASLGTEKALSTTTIEKSSEKSTLCVCNIQSFSPSMIPHGIPNAECAATVPNLKMYITPTGVPSLNAEHEIEQCYPNILTVKYSVPDIESLSYNLCRDQSMNSVLETEEVVVSSDVPSTSNGNYIETSTVVTIPTDNSSSSTLSDFSCTDPLRILKGNSFETDKCKDSPGDTFPWSLPVSEYQKVSVIDNLLVLPSEDTSSRHLEPPDFADKNVIVVNADETFASPCSDTVFVIPDGAFIIMDMEDMSLEPVSEPNLCQTSI